MKGHGKAIREGGGREMLVPFLDLWRYGGLMVSGLAP